MTKQFEERYLLFAADLQPVGCIDRLARKHDWSSFVKVAELMLLRSWISAVSPCQQFDEKLPYDRLSWALAFIFLLLLFRRTQ